MDNTSKFKVLAVDDSLVTLKILKKIIKDSEFEIVAESTSGEDALIKYDEVQPDLVLLDIIMPEMDRIKKIKKIIAKDPSAKIVMVSSMGTKEKVMESLEKGAKNFVMKPYEKSTLLEVMKKVCSNEIAES